MTDNLTPQMRDEIFKEAEKLWYDPARYHIEDFRNFLNSLLAVEDKGKLTERLIGKITRWVNANRRSIYHEGFIPEFIEYLRSLREALTVEDEGERMNPCPECGAELEVHKTWRECSDCGWDSDPVILANTQEDEPKCSECGTKLVLVKSHKYGDIELVCRLGCEPHRRNE